MKIKNEDEYVWQEYTKEYSDQIINSVAKDNTLLIDKFKIKGKKLIYDESENIHPNWKEIYSMVISHSIKSVFECGCGSGQHLLNILKIKPKIKFSGCDLLSSQLVFGEKLFKLGESFNKNIHIMDFSIKDAYKNINEKYELVYSQAVITHLSTDNAIRFIENMMYLSSKYVLLIERADDHDFKSMVDGILEKNKDLNFSFSYTNKYLKTGILLKKEII